MEARKSKYNPQMKNVIYYGFIGFSNKFWKIEVDHQIKEEFSALANLEHIQNHNSFWKTNERKDEQNQEYLDQMLEKFIKGFGELELKIRSGKVIKCFRQE